MRLRLLTFGRPGLWVSRGKNFLQMSRDGCGQSLFD